MPNRQLHENIRHSEKVEGLSDAAFRLLILLISCADDWGRYHADPRLVKSACYQYDSHTPADVGHALDELQTKDMLSRYEDGDHIYLQIHQWHQRSRANKSKFPDPKGLQRHVIPAPDTSPSNDGHARPRYEDEDEERGTNNEVRGSGAAHGYFPLTAELYEKYPGLAILHSETRQFQRLTLEHYLKCKQSRSRHMDFIGACKTAALRAELMLEVKEPGAFLHKQFDRWEREHVEIIRRRQEQADRYEKDKRDLVSFIKEMGEAGNPDAIDRQVADYRRTHGQKFIDEVQAACGTLQGKPELREAE